MKKKMLFTLAVIATIQCGTVAYAGTITESANTTISNQISTRAEQREWKFRIVNGQQQKRLWSVTYGHWIGEWENF